MCGGGQVPYIALVEVAVQLDSIQARQAKDDAEAVRRLFRAHKHDDVALEGALAKRWREEGEGGRPQHGPRVGKCEDAMLRVLSCHANLAWHCAVAVPSTIASRSSAASVRTRTNSCTRLLARSLLRSTNRRTGELSESRTSSST